MPGRFITVEGIEGAGKSTQLPYIRDLIEAAGWEVLMTREPGGTPLGEDIRHLVLDHRDPPAGVDAELLLLFAARAEHLTQRILPALAAGKWVVCDRFTDATYAYQGGGRGAATARIAVLEDWVQGPLRPDLTLLFEVPVAAGLARAQQRAEPDRFESEQQAFFERVRRTYLDRLWSESTRFRLIDASQSLEGVREQVCQALAGFLRAARLLPGSGAGP
jgi:dTMP kinase